MKCLRCGKVIPSGINVCENCGFDLAEFKSKKVFREQEDPDVLEQHKVTLIDNPILTFIFGLLSVASSFLFATAETIVILYLVLVILFNVFTFKMANKPCKVKLKPLNNVGKILAYFSIGFILFRIIYQVIGILFF